MENIVNSVKGLFVWVVGGLYNKYLFLNVLEANKTKI